ncbi:S8 family serine peptidase [Spirosoma taeanense]|uniref:S8 family serine peptidase n=1 Tax=Spirosoma taeanense TaxID=2735870 RepID=A0A6M5Y364_9BACT|nr:S8 family serine peptidase [Spirosoma taeanense]QJW89027.1 S8 family serine peptidase [Spirosoma taeanense]
MRSRTMGMAVTLLSACILGSCRPGAESVNTKPDERLVPGEYIVVYKADPLAGAKFINTYDGRTQSVRQYTRKLLTTLSIKSDQIDQVYGTAIKGFSARLTKAEAEQLRQNPQIAYIEQSRYVNPDEPQRLDESNARATAGQEVPWGIKYVGGFVDYSGSNAAWIVDTGIDLDHKDLNVDVKRGKNFVTSGQGAKTLDDQHGHGSHMAGIIAARNNSIGVVGVAAGAPVVPVKVGWRFQDITTALVIAGVDYVAANAKSGDVVNLSVGAYVTESMDAAVLSMARRGDLFVAISAGNAYNGNYDANNISPGRINAPNVYTLSAYDDKGMFAKISCAGNPPIDFSTPGVRIKSTVNNGGYATFTEGTSMATAHMAGILLANGGVVYAKGYVKADRDGVPDAIASRIP